MSRAWAALFVAPLLVAAAYGFLAIFAAPIMLVSAAAVGVPMLLVLRKLNRLAWPYAVASGLLASAPFIVLYIASSDPYHVEYTGMRNALALAATGCASGLAFWWLGVFRNPAFPTVSSSPPWSMLALAPVVFLGIYYWHVLEPTTVEGTVQAVLEPSASDRSRSGAVRMRLKDGKEVVARLPATADSQGQVGLCYWASERSSALLKGKVYFLHAPQINGCK
jgi:hypothetical protein